MIVARGLGRGLGRILVTAGLGLVVVTSPSTTGGGGGRVWTDEDHRAAVEAKWEVIERHRGREIEPAVAVDVSTSVRRVLDEPSTIDRQPDVEASPQLLPQLPPQQVPADEVAQFRNPTIDPSLAVLLATVAAEPGPQAATAVSDEEIALILLAIAAADPSTAA